MDVGTGYRELGPDELVEKGDEWWDDGTWTPQVAGHFGVLKTSDPAYTFHTFRRAVPEAKPGTVLESGYRLLKRGDVVQLFDEILRKGTWRLVPPRECGWKIDKVRGVRRRKTPEGHFQDIQKLAASTPLSKEEATKAAGILPNIPADSQTFLSHDERDYISRELGSLMQSIARGTRTEEELFRYLTKLAGICGTNLDLKPFTPNKYTRYIPTLDGRKVPVDVYCVSEAFGLSGCLRSEGAVDACNHAKKKLLAPGQRGAKTALQDITEARNSLTRAIELEGAVEG